MLSKIIDFAYLLEPTIFNSLFFEILFINSEVICEFEIYSTKVFKLIYSYQS